MQPSATTSVVLLPPLPLLLLLLLLPPLPLPLLLLLLLLFSDPFLPRRDYSCPHQP
jgi:hypothetical protein